MRSLGLILLVAGWAGGVFAMERKTELATFAGGCFWCMVHPFEQLDGVVRVVAGYTGGIGPAPTYETYARRGHIEAVRIEFDPSRVAYARLVEEFWRQIDPTDAGGQFVDRGPQYRTAVFYHSPEQRVLAEDSKRRLDRSGRFQRPVVTEILPAGEFFPAEEYHQGYYLKNPFSYKMYRINAGRDQFLDKTWGRRRE